MYLIFYGNAKNTQPGLDRTKNLRYNDAMKTMHLFAGAGGGLLADLIIGHTTTVAVEWDAYACRVLRERAAEGWFPGLHVHEGDARLFDPSYWKGRVDSIHAGFPCQDISVAGNGVGITGERSGLWREVVRCADIIRPRELFLENSPAITSRGLGAVLGDLAILGYDARWCVLPASAVGAPHLRARWWCLARLANAGSGRLGEQEEREDQQPRRAEAIGSGETINEYGCWWSTEPNVGRVANGVAHRSHRIKALGNGQVPLQAAAAYMILSNGLIQ